MKPKTKRLFSKSLSIFLALLMAFYVMPLNVFSQTGSDVPDNTETTDNPLVQETEETITEEAYVLGEVESLRTDSTKHFRMSDGSYVAVEYGKTVHFKDDNGVLQDFDNTLSFEDAINTDDISGYSSSKNDVKIKFANNSNSSSLINLKNGNYSVSLDLVNSLKTSAVKTNPEKALSEKPTIEEAAELTKYSSSVTYADILENTDLQYIMYGNNLKENIIVKAKSDNYVYEFELNLKGLFPVLNEDGSISLHDNASKEIIFTIPAGYMFDANGEYSDAVKYSLEQKEDMSYSLIVTADADWINADGRAFPVTVDPTIWRTNQTVYSNVKDTYITSAYPTSIYGGSECSYTGYQSGHEYISLVGIRQLPEIPKASVVVDAKLGLFVYSYTTSVNIGAYAVTSPWESYEVTWNTKPTIDTTVLDYQNINAVSNINDYDTACYFDITSITQDWYSKKLEPGITSANGVALRVINSTINNRVEFTTANHSYNGAFPIYIISYRDTKGLESRWSYTSHGAGNAGTGYVNDFTGNLVFAHGDISTNGSILPVSVDHVFNTELANTDFTYTASGPYTASFTNMKVGKGWKLSVQETIIERTLNYDTWFCYSDADGTELYFNDFNTAGQYISEDGYGLTITKNTGSIPERYTMVDDYGNKKTFNSSGYITYIRDIMGNEKSFVYTSNRLTSIQYKPAGSGSYITQLSFSYNLNNALYRVTNSQSGDYVEYYYSPNYNDGYSTSNAGYLRKIQYNSGAYSYYEYFSDGRLNCVWDGDTGSKVSYSYSVANDAIVNKTYQVSTVTEKTLSEAEGQKIGFIYDYKKTSVRTRGKDDIYNNSDDILTTYIFDNNGRTICAYSSNLDGSTIYGTSNAVYEAVDINDGSKKVNTITKDSVAGTPAMNLVKNSGAESASYWTQSCTDITYQITEVTSSQKYMGNYSFRTYSSNTTGFAKFSQSVIIPTAGKYTLSAYVKTAFTSGTGGAYLTLSGTTSDKVTGTTNTGIQNGWQRISVTKDFASSGTYTAELNLLGAIGNAYFDCIQLEKGNAPSAFNIINNGSFELQQDWNLLYGGSYINLTGSTHGQVMMFTGNPTGSRQTFQSNVLNVPINTTFVLSGWAMASSASLDKDTTRNFELEARISYSDGTYNSQYVKFNPDYNGWQFASGAIVPKNETAATITSINVFCKYYKNVNTAYFDNISLTMEPAQTYTYNDEGNIDTVTNAEGNKSNTVYDANNVDLASYTNIVGQRYEYDYLQVGGVSAHLVNTIRKSSIASKTITTSYTYDSYGNVTGSTTTSSAASGVSLTNSSTYDYYGNYLNNSTDARGKVTDYNYSTATGLLNFVQDANASRIAYKYDSRDRVTDFYLDTDCDSVIDSGEKKVSYSYSQNRLSQIITAGTTYNMTYDIYGNTSSVGVYGMSSTLATYTYATNNGKITKTEYGNGFYTENVYDELNRVIAIKYNGVEKFKFTYNVSGQLYSSTDLVNSKTYTYEYDSLGRLIRAAEKTTSGTLVMVTENLFDSYGRASNSSYTFSNNDLLNYSIQYNNNSSLISQYNLPNDKTITYNYDAFDRVSSKALSNAYSISYTYKTGVDSSKTTALISELRINNEGSATDTYYNYTYDNVGNILTVSENGVQKQSYEYDALGQLTRENNVYANRTYVFRYNSAGNIYQKEEYSYTTGSLVGVPLLDAEAYFYQNSNWGDLLTNLNGTAITYDNIGNPLNWRNAYSLTWEGRSLKYIGFDAAPMSGMEFKYNSAGIRTYKNYYDMTTGVSNSSFYVLDGSKIIRETRTGSQAATLYYFYDESGVTGFNYNGSDYYYGKNLQGDITKIYDWFGNEVTSYTYDAWGKIISIGGSLASTVGQANPFRYRSYYYDTETGWYYLNSRYYDPVTSRFLNADKQLNPQEGMTGFNLYQYCGNNPVNRHDPDGTCWHYLGLGDCYTCKAYKEHQEYLASGPATPVGSLEWEIELKVSYGMTAYNFVAASSVVTAGSVAIVAAAAPIAVSAPLYVAPVAAEVAATSTATAKGAQKVFEFVQNKIINLERVGSALQSDAHHAFSNIVDNYAGYATQTPLNNATLYQLQGALNGVAGRFEWIVQAGQVTHRMFVKGGGMNGIPIIK